MANQEVGFVTSVNDFLIHLEGLPTVKINDVIESDGNLRGWVTGLHKDQVEALIFNGERARPGQQFKKSLLPLSVGVGEHLLGRAINPVGVAIDGKGLLTAPVKNYPPLDNQAPGISSRQFISEQFVTGITLIDMLIPLGKGQRELVLGDARSGKTSFLLSLIVNQKQEDTICIYACIGKPSDEVKTVIDVLKANNELKNTVVIAAASSDPPPLIFLAPQTAFTLAEYFQKKGKDVIVILDDMGNHAKIYREIALLSNRIPGRESYPGDIFYQHAHLFERAGKFKEEAGGGSITAIPSIEINLADFATFIPTNLMAMTDGHLLFHSSLYNSGQRPAIDISLSVSRVGLQTQNVAQKQLSSHIKSLLAQTSQLQTLSHFSGELPPETQLLSRQAEIIKELLKQDSLTLIPRHVQVLLLSLAFTNFFLKKDASFISRNKVKIIELFEKDAELVKLSKTLATIETEEELLKLAASCIPKLEGVCK